MSEATLYSWPAAAKFGRVVPKTKFYEHAKVSAAVRKKFVTDVGRITWAYKLADSTIQLRGDAAVPEIQVFVIDAKESDVSDDVLLAIDRAVQFPIFFEINRGTGEAVRTRMVAAHKQPIGARQRVSVYFSTDWLSTQGPRAPLPPALDLSNLYAAVLAPLIPIATRPGERLSDATERLDQVHQLERVIAALEKRLRTEPQFNRKVELRRQLRDETATLQALTDSSTSESEDALGKDSMWTS